MSLYRVSKAAFSPSRCRTVYELCSGQRLDKLEFPAVRGLQGVKEATVVIPVNPKGPLKNKEVRETRSAEHSPTSGQLTGCQWQGGLVGASRQSMACPTASMLLPPTCAVQPFALKGGVAVAFHCPS